MDRRSLLAGVSGALLGGAAGCIGGLEGTGDNGAPDEPIDLDCEPYEGEFGFLIVGVPVAVPDDATVIDIEETGLLEYDVVETEMENARENRSEAEDRISEYDDEGEMSQTGSVRLGNGDRYEDVEASLDEYESIESEHLGPRWHVTYRGDVYGLSLGSNPLPIPLGDTSDDESGWSANLQLYVVESVPDDADVIDAVEAGLDDREYLGELLTIAACSDELEDVPDRRDRIAKSHVPADEAQEFRDTFEDRRSDGDWYLEYAGEVYRLDLTIGAP